MKIKKILKKNKIIRKIGKNFRIKCELNKDYKLFKKNYQENMNKKTQIEYSIMLLVHSLEKGFCHDILRPFGIDKVSELLINLKKYRGYGNNQDSTAFLMGISILNNWKNSFEKNNWNKPQIYFHVVNFLNSIDDLDQKTIDVGARKYSSDEYHKYLNFDYYDAISTRHSVRNFQDKLIKKDDLKYCVNSAILTPTACNRQMVKLYYVIDDEKRNELKKYIMGLSGFNKETVNLFIVTFDVSAFTFYGERNQGYLNAGLFSMNLVNAMHFKGIGSCFLQWGNTNNEESKIKKKLGIPEKERIAIVIGAGYYVDESLIAKSARKSINEVFTIIK